MDAVTLTHQGLLTGVSTGPPRAGIDSRPLRFSGKTATGKTFTVFIFFPDTLWRLHDDQNAVLAALSNWAVSEIEARIRAGEHEVLSGDDAINPTLLSERSGEVENLLAAQGKECRWQRRRAGALFCEATDVGEDPATTSALCGGCSIPDERCLCSELVVLPTDVVNAADRRPVPERAVEPAPIVGPDPA